MFCADVTSQTADDHRMAESQPFIRDLVSGRLNVQAFVHLLEGLEPVYTALEQSLLRLATDASVAVLDHRALDRAARIRADLCGFGRTIAEERPLASSAGYARAVRESAASPQRLLAHHYTRYLGDIAGGQVIARMMTRHYELPASSMTYLDFTDLGDAHHYRKQYRTLLDLMPWGPSMQAEFISECHVAYRCSAQLFAELGERVGVSPSGEQPVGAFVSAERRHLRPRRDRR